MEVKAWEKCARKLALNSEKQLSELKISLDNILRNCIDNSNDKKYFSLKISGKYFQSKIAAGEGGLEL